MKKLIFLLIFAAAWAGAVYAQDVAYPPGVFDFEAALYGDSADGRAVAPHTVPVAVLLYAGQSAGVVADYYNSAIGHIVYWGEQYQSGELTKQEFTRLVAAQIETMLDRQYLFGGYSLVRGIDYPLR